LGSDSSFKNTSVEFCKSASCSSR